MHQLIRIYLLFVSISIIPLYGTKTDPVLVAITLKKEAEKPLRRQKEKLQKVKDKERKSAREHKFKTLPSSDNLSVIIGTLGVFTGPTQLACYKLAEEGRIKDLAKHYKLDDESDKQALHELYEYYEKLRIEDLGDLYEIAEQERIEELVKEYDLLEQEALIELGNKYDREVQEREKEKLLFPDTPIDSEFDEALTDEVLTEDDYSSEEDQYLWDELNKEEQRRQDQAMHEENKRKQKQQKKRLKHSKKKQQESMNRLLRMDPTNIPVVGFKTRKKHLQY